MTAAKELDELLRRFVTPVLSMRGLRKSGHSYRKRYEGGDWAVISFRGHPTGLRGSFLAEASFVPDPTWDWFCFQSPSLATTKPQGWWLDWSNPLAPHNEGSIWTYETDDERNTVASVLIDRLNEVVTLFDGLAASPQRQLALVLDAEVHNFGELPHLGRKFQSRTWRTCLLARAGYNHELEEALQQADLYPNLRLRPWVEYYVRTRRE